MNSPTNEKPESDLKIERQKFQLHKNGYEGITKAIESLKENDTKEVQKIELVQGETNDLATAFFSMLRGKQGNDGKTPTKEELTSIIKPLIPAPIHGKNGKDYVLTNKDKEIIANLIKVPVVKKVIEKTERIVEKPFTIDKTVREVVEVAKYELGEDIVKKINDLKKAVFPIDSIIGLSEALSRRPSSGGGISSLRQLTDVDYSGLSQDSQGRYILGSGSGGGGSQTPWTSDIDAAGFTLYGNSTAAGNLQLSSTSHATKGDILFGTRMVYDEVNNRLAMGTATGVARINLPDAGTTIADGISQGDISIYRSAATTIRIGSSSISTRYLSIGITAGNQTISAGGSSTTPALILATTQTGTPILTLGSTNNVATLTRNVNDANTLFTLTQTHASSTGNIQDWANSSGVVSAMTRAGNLAIGATSTVASAALEIVSTTKGLLIPRMTTAQRTAIASPAEGLHVYDLTLNAPYYYNGTSWVAY